VVAVFPLGLEGGGGAVGEERVVAPDGEQFALLADGGGFGLGIEDEFTGVGVGHGGGVGDLLPRPAAPASPSPAE
jgi:hypothetical protein